MPRMQGERLARGSIRWDLELLNVMFKLWWEEAPLAFLSGVRLARENEVHPVELEQPALESHMLVREMWPELPFA